MAATRTTRNGVSRFLPLLATPMLLTTLAFTQAPERLGDTTLPANAQVLEGLPHVRIDATKERVVRRELDATEAAKSLLTIKIRDGRFYAGDRTGIPLRMTTAGGFTYLSSTEPGRYIRIQRLNDRFSYVEHVDMAFGTVTYWGELRVVLGK